jgi:hypothetical protein
MKTGSGGDGRHPGAHGGEQHYKRADHADRNIGEPHRLVCNIVQRIPRNAIATGFELPFNETADPDITGSAAIRLRLATD